MSTLAVPVPATSATSTGRTRRRTRSRTTPPVARPETGHAEHRWELRLEEFEDGLSVRLFECVDCAAVRFE